MILPRNNDIALALATSAMVPLIVTLLIALLVEKPRSNAPLETQGMVTADAPAHASVEAKP